MPKLFSSRYIVHVLTKSGFAFISQKGSHAKYRGVVLEQVHTVIVPIGRREIPYGTFRSIVRQSGLLEERFKE